MQQSALVRKPYNYFGSSGLDFCKDPILHYKNNFEWSTGMNHPVEYKPQAITNRTSSDCCYIYMEQNRSTVCFIWLFPFLHFPSLVQCLKNNFDESLDAILHDHAFRVMSHQHHPHTDELYNASLPEYLAGMKVSVVGLRSRTLWRKGANFSDFVIPPKTLPVPYVKRLLIVYHNLGNWSSSYYSLSGYTLLSPVVGFLVYDASYLSSKNLSKLELNTNGKPISIEFHNSSLARGSNQMTKCAAFGAYGEVFISEMSLPNMCYSRSQGHFSIVIPFKKKHKIWLSWIVGFLAGFLGLVLVGLAGIVAVRSLLVNITQEMEKEADEGECLQTYWIDNSKMPRAEVTRTQPVLECKTLPNPKMSWYA